MLATLALIGDFWALSVIRCAVYGLRRFTDFERELGVATNVLTDRLHRLTEAGVIERTQYQSNPPRYEYGLTDAGRELAPVIVALKLWGDRHLQADGPWTSLHHRGCGISIEVRLMCPDCNSQPAEDELDITFVR